MINQLKQAAYDLAKGEQSGDPTTASAWAGGAGALGGAALGALSGVYGSQPRETVVQRTKRIIRNAVAGGVLGGAGGYLGYQGADRLVQGTSGRSIKEIVEGRPQPVEAGVLSSPLLRMLYATTANLGARTLTRGIVAKNMTDLFGNPEEFKKFKNSLIPHFGQLPAPASGSSNLDAATPGQAHWNRATRTPITVGTKKVTVPSTTGKPNTTLVNRLEETWGEFMKRHGIQLDPVAPRLSGSQGMTNLGFLKKLQGSATAQQTLDILREYYTQRTGGTRFNQLVLGANFVPDGGMSPEGYDTFRRRNGFKTFLDKTLFPNTPHLALGNKGRMVSRAGGLAGMIGAYHLPEAVNAMIGGGPAKYVTEPVRSEAPTENAGLVGSVLNWALSGKKYGDKGLEPDKTL